MRPNASDWGRNPQMAESSGPDSVSPDSLSLDSLSLGGAQGFKISDRPVIPFIQGDGIGQDIWPGAKIVFDGAVKAAFGARKKVNWLEVEAGEKGVAGTGDELSDPALKILQTHWVSIRGPLARPRGKQGVAARIRKHLNLYAWIRPVQYCPPIPSPMFHPQRVNMVVFWENSQDLYTGIGGESRSWEPPKLPGLLKSQLNCDVPASCSLGIKPISPEKTRRLVIKAFEYAFANHRKSVTLMHRGNPLKITRGGGGKWGYEAAFETFGHRVITEERLFELHEGIVPEGHVVIKERIADMVFAEILLWPENFDIIACLNETGKYLYETLAAQVGGLVGMTPGASMGDGCALFEVTHGPAWDIAGKDLANPCSFILSGAMMFDHMGWHTVSELIRKGVAQALAGGKVTRDLALRIKGSKEVTCSRFSRLIAEHILFQP